MGIPVEASRRFSTVAGVHWVSIGDLNGDGRNDIIVANLSATTLGLFLAR